MTRLISKGLDAITRPFVRYQISSSIDRVSEFYSESGIYLPETPTFIYLDRYFRKSKNTPAEAVKLTAKAIGTVTGDIMKKSLELEARFYDKLGLSVSNEAINEIVGISMERGKMLHGLTDADKKRMMFYGVDIVYYRPIRDYIAEGGKRAGVLIDSITVHELWHLIELNEGIDGSSFREGAAKFAERVWEIQKGYYDPNFVPGEGKETFSEDPLMDAIYQKQMEEHYEKSLDFVSLHAKSLHDLLNPGIRSKIEHDYGLYLERVQQEMEENPDYKLASLASRAMMPEFDILDGALTKDNLLIALRAYGAAKLAQEMETQDVSGLLEHWSKLGYGPKSREAQELGRRTA